jgi:ABC-type sugar transport system ATPase subunit
MPQINLLNGNIKEGLFTGFNTKNESIIKCKVPKEIVNNSEDTKGIVIGLRPEILRLTEKTSKIPDDECMISGTSDTVEYLGSEYHVGLNLGGRVITCRFPANDEIRHGQKIDVCFKINKAHFFNEATGLRLKGGD